MKNPTLRKPAGFTLIEVMTVIAIIAVLAGMSVMGFSYAKDKQRQTQAKLQIALLSKAIDEYKADMGVFPGPESIGVPAADSSEELYRALFYEGYDYTKGNNPPAAGAAMKIYLPDLDPRANNKQGWVRPVTSDEPPQTSPILDPWGTPYQFRHGGGAENQDFDVYSFGKDKIQSQDDIKN